MRETLKKARREAGLTQQAMADKLGSALFTTRKLNKAVEQVILPCGMRLKILQGYINEHSERFQIIIPSEKPVGRNIE